MHHQTAAGIAELSHTKLLFPWLPCMRNDLVRDGAHAPCMRSRAWLGSLNTTDSCRAGGTGGELGAALPLPHSWSPGLPPIVGFQVCFGPHLLLLLLLVAPLAQPFMSICVGECGMHMLVIPEGVWLQLWRVNIW